MNRTNLSAEVIDEIDHVYDVCDKVSQATRDGVADMLAGRPDVPVDPSPSCRGTKHGRDSD